MTVKEAAKSLVRRPTLLEVALNLSYWTLIYLTF